MSEESIDVPNTSDIPASVKLDTGMTLQGSQPGSPQVDEDALSLPKARATSPDSPVAPDQMRRASGKIANLRAAFEQKGLKDGSPPRPPISIIGMKRFEKSPALGTGWEAEMAKLKEDLEKETEMRRIYEEKCIELQTQLEGLSTGSHQSNGESHDREQQPVELERERLEAIEESNKLQRQLEDVQQERAQLVAEAKRMQRQVAELEHDKARALEELSDTQRQVSDLKRNISTSTRTPSQVTDAVFAQELLTLHHETQNWIVHHFRRARTDKSASEMCECLTRIAEPEQLSRLRPIYSTFTPEDRLPILQTTAVSYMMEIFEEPLLFGMPSQQDWKKGIRRTAEGLPSILSPAVYNRWRASTLDAIRDTDAIREAVDSAAASMAEMICITLMTLTGLTEEGGGGGTGVEAAAAATTTESEEKNTRISSLKAIIGRAIQLAHLFRVQRAQFEFSLPGPGMGFDAETMEEISVEEEEEEGEDGGRESVGRRVRCATFPSVRKFGDENGDDLGLVNVIAKARVLCCGNT